MHKCIVETMHETNATRWQILCDQFDVYLKETGAEALILQWDSETTGFVVVGSCALKSAVTKSKKELDDIAVNLKSIQVSYGGGNAHTYTKDEDATGHRLMPDSVKPSCPGQNTMTFTHTLPDVEEEPLTRNTINSERSPTILGNKYEERKASVGTVAGNHVVNNAGANIAQKRCGRRGNKQKTTVKPSTSLKSKCEHCGKCVASPHHLKHHMKKHVPVEKPHECEICGQCFEFFFHYNLHVKKHSEVYEKQCNKCGETFKNRNDFIAHYRKKHRPPCCKCQFCGKGFFCEQQRVTHERIHTGEKPFQCDRCDKCFRAKKALNNHQNTHLGLRPFTCEICQAAFSEKRNLNNHLKIHSGDRPYSCDQCGKAFITKNNLELHVRRHVGDMPFICDQCGKSFYTKYLLSIHMKNHTGESMYKCAVCDYRTVTREKCKRHEATHSAEKPHQCSTCGRAFKRKDNLTAHVKTHNHENKITCGVCFKTYLNKRSFLRHSETHVDGGSGSSQQQLVSGSSQCSSPYAQTAPTNSLHAHTSQYLGGVLMVNSMSMVAFPSHDNT